VSVVKIWHIFVKSSVHVFPRALLDILISMCISLINNTMFPSGCGSHLSLVAMIGWVHTAAVLTPFSACPCVGPLPGVSISSLWFLAKCVYRPWWAAQVRLAMQFYHS
jgi:hypothetical protein